MQLRWKEYLLENNAKSTKFWEIVALTRLGGEFWACDVIAHRTYYQTTSSRRYPNRLFYIPEFIRRKDCFSIVKEKWYYNNKKTSFSARLNVKTYVSFSSPNLKERVVGISRQDSPVLKMECTRYSRMMGPTCSGSIAIWRHLAVDGPCVTQPTI